MKTILLILAGFLPALTFAQKQKISLEDDTIQVNGINYAVMVKQGSKMGADFRVKSLDGKDLINLQFLEFNNPNKVSSSNPNGRVTYYEVTFLNDGQKCEIVSPGAKKLLAKKLVEEKLIRGNEVDAEAEKTFVLINGMKFSEEKKNTSGTTIIINR